MAEVQLIHDSRGLHIQRNAKNQFVVCTLRYDADPSKRSSEWLNEAKAGMSAAQFAREYEIDYGAMFGERVFPEVLAHRECIVVPEPLPDFPSDQVFYGGFDFGIRNATSFLVFCVYDGIIYCVWELYHPCTDLNVLAKEILSCPYWTKIRWIAADTHIRDTRHFKADGAPSSVCDQLNERGVTKLLFATAGEQAWLAKMRSLWADPEDPKFRIFSCCPNTIREFADATFVGQKGTEQIVSNFKEKIMDVGNHSLDATKYFMLLLPSQTIPRKVNYPDMKMKWAK